MSTVVCRQPSKPSMESSHVVEATTMKLKLVSPKSYTFGGWNNLLQSPPSHNSIDGYFETERNPYVQNHKSLKLSEKSLQLCTESLGSESGSDTSEDDAIFACPVPASSSSSSVTKRSRRDRAKTEKVCSRSFPPPLTTMSGFKPFQVRPHREGGRLIIEAMEMSLGIKGCLRAERSGGRLRLMCWKDDEYDYEDDCDRGSEESEEETERNVVVEKFQRLRRCNEDENGDKGICYNWEPCCWVATS